MEEQESIFEVDVNEYQKTRIMIEADCDDRQQ